MKKGILVSFLAVTASTLLVAQVQATNFTAGDLALFQADSASANNTTFTIVEISPTTAGQTSPGVQSIPINGTTGSTALRTSGSATSTGYLAQSNDRTLLSFTAHNSTTTSGNANTILPRGVGTLDAATNFTLQTTYTGTSGNQTRSATTLNNTDWFIGDQGGIYTNGTTSASPTGNVRGTKSFGGTVYTLQQSSTATNIVVSTVSAPSGGTLTGLPGLTNNAQAQDFYMVSSGTHGSLYDELYITTNSSATVGIILKFSYDPVGNTWASNGTATTTFGGFGLAAALDPLGGQDLYVTTGSGATAVNNVLKLVDSAGWNQNINLGAATTLYTAPTGTTVKGIDFAPVAVPEPSSVALATLGLVGLGLALARRR